MALTDEKKAMALQSHKDSMEEMGKDVEFINNALGRNHSAAQKMRQIHEIMGSMTEEEIYDLSEQMEEIMKTDMAG